MEKIKRFCVYFWAVVLIIVDQIVKVAVVTNIKDDAVTIIKGILRFSYCENEGVAFSLGNGHVPVFIVLNLLMICGLVVFYERNKKNFNLVNKIFFTMVIAGGTSNLIDRAFRGYVIDFIDIGELFDFAIFNVADIYVTCSVFILAFLILFYYKEEDLQFGGANGKDQ